MLYGEKKKQEKETKKKIRAGCKDLLHLNIKIKKKGGGGVMFAIEMFPLTPQTFNLVSSNSIIFISLLSICIYI